jgi:hypothetical protein
MDANRRQSGIQQLLAAEQEAQQIVNAARAGNTYFLIFGRDYYKSSTVFESKYLVQSIPPCILIHQLIFMGIFHIVGTDMFTSEREISI